MRHLDTELLSRLKLDVATLKANLEKEARRQEEAYKELMARLDILALRLTRLGE